MTCQDLRDPRFDYRKFAFCPADADVKQFVKERESEGWVLWFRRVSFDFDDKPEALELGFRKQKAPPAETVQPV